MRVTRALLYIATFFPAAAPTAAQTVTYVAQERRVSAMNRERVYNDGGGIASVTVTDEVTAPDFNEFDARAAASVAIGEADVSQHSSLRPDGITASGSMSGETGEDGIYKWETVVAATFDLADAQAQYDLIYAIDDFGPQPYRRDNEFVLTKLSPDAAAVFELEVPHDRDEPVTTGSLSGVLSPGRYEFRYRDESTNDISLTGDYDWSFRVAPVPEPAGVAGLLAFAVAALLRRRATLSCAAESTPFPLAFVLVAGLSVAATPVTGQTVAYVEQERRVRAFHREHFRETQESVSDIQELTAPDFADFHAAALARAVPEWNSARSEVSQRSSLDPGAITASGRIHGRTGTLTAYNRWSRWSGRPST